MLHQGQPKKVLITGGSGFLGRYLAKHLSKVHQVRLTYATHRVNVPHCESVRMNLLHESTIRDACKDFEPDAVIHTAAVADAAKCEESPETALAVNATGTEKLMKGISKKDALFVYISTDLVFDGGKSFYTEEDEPDPISQYAKTKRRGEQAVQKQWRNHMILRPALIYGPELTAGRGSFLQWMDKAFEEQDRVSLFHDEYRTPVYVKDIAKAVAIAITRKVRHHILHLGGPERLTRVDFGRKLAEVRGYDAGKIEETSMKDIDTGYPRPQDVSLNSERIQEALALKLTPVEDGLREIFS